MDKVLDRVNNTEDLKKLKINEKELLAKNIRELIIETVSKNGGHLASNLGVVELTIALHSVFNAPVDKIIWDVGHQSYVHKILTGRKDKMPTLRQIDGMAMARDLKKGKEHIIAVIGDRSAYRRNGIRGIKPCRSIEN